MNFSFLFTKFGNLTFSLLFGLNSILIG